MYRETAKICCFCAAKTTEVLSSLTLIIFGNFFWLFLGTSVLASEVAEKTSDRALPPETSNQLGQVTGVEAIKNGTIDTTSLLNSDLELLTDSKLETASGLEQLTKVNQLRDVAPTDWAYEALRSLVDRYGCIAGYPNNTYRGSQAITRYEFAAGLNACLNQIERLIASSQTVSQQDLDTMQRLSQEFAAELATVEGRIDNLENRLAFIEDNRFSTTTKFSAFTWFNLTGAAADGDVLVETTDLSVPSVIRPPGRDPVTGEPAVSLLTDDPEITLSNLVWLTFETSFTGEDVLVTQLAVGNGDSPANLFASAGTYNTFGIPFTDQTAGVQGEGNSEVVIHDLYYNFPINDSFRIAVGPQINWYVFFEQNAYTYFLTGASSFNSIGSSLSNAVDRGSGAVVLWDISDKFKLNIGYLGESTEFLPSPPFNTASDPDKGVFGGTNTSTAELTYSPTDTFNARLMYNYTHLSSDVNVVGGVIGGVTGEPIQNGLADAGAGAGLDIDPNDGGLKDSFSHTVGFNFDWEILSKLGVFARYTYASITLKPIDSTVNVQSIQAGLAFPDVGKEGALGTFSFLIPFDVTNGEEYLVAGAGDGGTQYEFELSYFYPLNDNVALIPAFYLVSNPNNFDENPNIYVGNLRMQFSF
ncbi:iron uptake porin [Myxosarcina sp. GI1]|uniref:iron uptake porin n=1 Tax=Myxosarcina sp. GI1 TaxID=1541065 RepID=UPI00068C1043|nr:iron uptake porin [Myxosarcina sp. GI1]